MLRRESPKTIEELRALRDHFERTLEEHPRISLRNKRSADEMIFTSLGYWKT